jgi:hypothetical protein
VLAVGAVLGMASWAVLLRRVKPTFYVTAKCPILKTVSGIAARGNDSGLTMAVLTAMNSD